MFLKKKKIIIISSIITLAFIGIFIGRWGLDNVNAQSSYEELRIFTEVTTLIKKNYVDEVKVKDLIVGAIKGMLNTLDPHSGYMTPDVYKEFQTETKGEFGGVGIQIGIKDGLLTVIAPIEDTPAFKAGIEAGDRIIKISGELTKNMGLHEAVSKMRGPKGTSVTLTIMRETWKEPKDFTIVRDIIKIKSVKAKMLPDGIGYIKLTQFIETSASELTSAINKLKAEGMNSIILDLRNNPGGLLNVAVDVTSQFLPSKKLVVYIKGRTGERTEYFTDGKAPITDMPMVVLVNQGSASASEIVAGALKDWSRAIVIGVQTFGKGSVQSLIPLSDGSALKLTTAKYYTPNGTSIQGIGISPDILVKLQSKDGKEHPVIREKDLQRHLKNEQRDEIPQEDEKAPVEVDEKDDAQLQKAIDTLKVWKLFEKMPKKAA